MVGCLQRWQSALVSTHWQVWKCHARYRAALVTKLRSVLARKHSEHLRLGFRRMAHLVRVTSSVSEGSHPARCLSKNRRMKKLSRLMQGVQDVSSSVSLPARSQINESTPSSISEHKPQVFDIPASRCSPSKLASAPVQPY